MHRVCHHHHFELSSSKAFSYNFQNKDHNTPNHSAYKGSAEDVASQGGREPLQLQFQALGGSNCEREDSKISN